MIGLYSARSSTLTPLSLSLSLPPSLSTLGAGVCNGFEGKLTRTGSVAPLVSVCVLVYPENSSIHTAGAHTLAPIAEEQATTNKARYSVYCIIYLADTSTVSTCIDVLTIVSLIMSI